MTSGPVFFAFSPDKATIFVQVRQELELVFPTVDMPAIVDSLRKAAEGEWTPTTCDLRAYRVGDLVGITSSPITVERRLVIIAGERCKQIC
jgi:hypothetical protein